MIPHLPGRWSRRQGSLYLILIVLGWSIAGSRDLRAQLMGDFVDASQDFQKLESTYYVGSQVTDFDSATGAGKLRWDRYRKQSNFSFDKVDLAFTRADSNEFPGTEYDRDPVLPFSLTFVTPRTVRL